MKYDPKKHKFAVVQNGLALYGVGHTRDEAIADAADWISTTNVQQGEATKKDVEKLLDHGKGFRVHGEFYVIDNPDEIKIYVENI